MFNKNNRPKKDHYLNGVFPIEFHREWFTLLKFRQRSVYFDAVQDLRSSSGDSTADKFDELADHYLLKFGKISIATVRINLAKRGEMDCESYYRTVLDNSKRNEIASASRLVRNPKEPANFMLMRRFLSVVRADQAASGIRTEIINVQSHMLKYYEYMGYREVKGVHFRHPRLRTESIVMIRRAENVKNHCI